MAGMRRLRPISTAMAPNLCRGWTLPTLIVGGVGCGLFLAGSRGLLRPAPVALAQQQSQLHTGASSPAVPTLLGSFSVRTPQGQEVSLAQFDDKVVLVVNVASE